jgi:hypothetical protein
MKLKNVLLLIATLLITHFAEAQSSSKLIWSAYAELYYALDSEMPANNERANYLYNHKRNNELNINLAFVKAAYADKKTRANLALMVGTYAQYNLAAENALSQHIMEANIGVQLSKKNNIWLDAGVMPSHIGFESAIAQDCWTPSRSLVAENSPYFNTGVKLSGSNKKENLNASFLVLNGWQQIQKLPGQNTPSIGVQINYKPKSTFTLNYSNFIGSAKPDAAKALRTYHNIYAIYEPAKKWSVTAGIDIGSEKSGAQTNLWYTPVIISRYIVNTKSKIAARLEYFKDMKNTLISSTIPFQLGGASFNYDYQISENCIWRSEIKIYNDFSNFLLLNAPNNPKSFLTTLSIKF